MESILEPIHAGRTERLLEHARRGDYLNFDELLYLFPYEMSERLRHLTRDNFDRIAQAPGSSSNHQAWAGGYVDHVAETMNIGLQMFLGFTNLGRPMPFTLPDVLLVMFLHDLEKPWKHFKFEDCFCGHGLALHNRINAVSDASCSECRQCNMFRQVTLKTKEQRRAFRDHLIDMYGISLSGNQRNALQYVEGIPDSEYRPGERIMGELAAFCHSCDILSARCWHDWGKERSWRRA